MTLIQQEQVIYVYIYSHTYYNIKFSMSIEDKASFFLFTFQIYTSLSSNLSHTSTSLILVNPGDNLLNGLLAQILVLIILDNQNFEVLGSLFGGFDEGSADKSDSIDFTKLTGEVLLQDLLSLLIILSNSISLPFSKGTGGIGLEKSWLLVGIESSHKVGDTEGSDTTLLCIFLLDVGNVFGDIVDGGLIRVIQSIALAFDSGDVGKDSRISLETRKGDEDVVVELEDLFHGSGILKLGYILYFDTKNDTVLASDSNGAGTLFRSLDSILNLE